MITVVGLGSEKGDLSKKGEEAILSGGKVILKTALAKSSESVKALNVNYITLDEIYKKSRNFSTLNKNLAKAVTDESKNGDVVYCVDGAAQEDNSVRILWRRKDVNIINGVSKAASVAAAVKLDSSSCCVWSAYDISAYKRRTLPLIVYDIDNDFIAGDVKLALSDLIGEECPVTFVRGGVIKKIFLYELDRQGEYDYTSALVVEELPLTQMKKFDLVDLHDVIVRLRQPDGCPWDKVQTPESIKMSPVEEAYELLDAVNKKDDEKILEETGDILLQSVFYSVMKEEEDSFDLSDVITAECEKMITRHTHIFGGDKAADESEALSVWDKNKMAEKHQTTYSESVNDVPYIFPALMRAQKVSKRMAKGGWDFTDSDSAENKVREELKEAAEAVKTADKQKISDEVGDLLMSVVAFARVAGVDAEQSLLDSVEKVRKRFNAFEELALADGKDVSALTDEEWRYYYERAKNQCR